jgi:hypothetical protein
MPSRRFTKSEIDEARKDLDMMEEYPKVTFKLKGLTQPLTRTQRNRNSRRHQEYPHTPPPRPTRKRNKSPDTEVKNIDNDYKDSDYKYTPSEYSDEDLAFLTALVTYKKKYFDTIDQDTKDMINSAIKYTIARNNKIISTKSDMTSKILKLMAPDVITKRISFITSVFGYEASDSLKTDINEHLQSLKQLSEINSISTSEPDLRNFLYTIYQKECKPLQEIVLASLPEKLREAYTRFTTPLFFALVEKGLVRLPKIQELLKEFFYAIESEPRAVTHVFSDSLFIVLHIHLGFWRQEFNDGHLLMKTPSLAVTIETLGKENAIGKRGMGKGKPKKIMPTKLPMNSDENFECPCCTRVIGTPTATGTFRKSGERSAVDHTNPVGYAYIIYNANALCAQLVYLCYDCNAYKSDTDLIEFFDMICNRSRPNGYRRFYEFGKAVGDITLENPLTTEEYDKREKFYIINIRYTLGECGVNSFEEMIDKAIMLKKLYIETEMTKDEIIKKARRIDPIVDGVAALITLYSGIRATNPAALIDSSITNIKKLFGSLLSHSKFAGNSEDEAINILKSTIQLRGRESEDEPITHTHISVKMLEQCFIAAAASSVTNTFANILTYHFTAQAMALHLAHVLNGLTIEQVTPETIIAEEPFIKFCKDTIKELESKHAIMLLPVDTGSGKKKKKKSKKNKTYKHIKRR